MKKYYGLTGLKLNIAIGVIAGLDFLLFGYDQGVLGGLLTFDSFTSQFPEIDYYDITDPSRRSTVSTYNGITVASYTLGCFFGAVATIWIGNWLGRRKTIFVGSCIMIVGAILQTSAFALAHLIVGRLITGFGNGMNTSTVPMWQSETSKSHRRGQLVMIEGALITAGVMLSYWIDFGFQFLDPAPISWRFPIAFQLVFAIIIITFILGLPESPRWLILKGKEDEALEVLCALNDIDKEDQYIKNEFIAIKDTVLEESKGSFRDCFTMGPDRHLHRTALAYVNQMFQQISGINLITYYAATVYKAVGLTGYLPTLLAAINGTEYHLASWIAVFIIEKVGRRKLMIFGAAGMSLTAVLLSVVNSIVKPGTMEPKQGPGIAAVVFLFVFNTFFAIGWLGMTWLYPAEIVPLRIRAPANAISTSANWLFNFIIVMIVPVSFASIGYQTYIIFAVINAAMVPSVYFFFPETAYRSLEEMDTIFAKSTNIFNVVKIAKEEPRRYGKNGEWLINYDDTEAAQNATRRRSSVASYGSEKRSSDAEHIDNDKSS